MEVTSKMFAPTRHLLHVAICLGMSTVPVISGDESDPAPGSYDHLTISCASAAFTVSGRVVFHGADGALHPMRDVHFTMSSHGTVHANTEKARSRTKVDRQGQFSLTLVLWSDAVEYFQGDKLVALRDVDDKGTLLLQAPGCEDRVLEFEGDLQAGDIEMMCADHHGPRALSAYGLPRTAGAGLRGRITSTGARRR